MKDYSDKINRKKQIIRNIRVIVALFIFGFFISFNVKAYAREIANNGLGGIYIDIESDIYKQPGWFYYGDPYGTRGCTWFVGARVKELTNNNDIYTYIQWIEHGVNTLHYTRVYSPMAKSVICWGKKNANGDFIGHVAIIEKIEGEYAYISEGGNALYGQNDYCCITKQRLTDIPNLNPNFLGYVYFGDYCIEKNYTSVFPLEDGSIYHIRNASTNKILEIQKNNYDNNAQILWADDAASPYQQWKAIKLGDGYAFENVMTKKVFQIRDDSTYQGAQLVQNVGYYASKSSQHFKLIDAGNGNYTIISACSNLAIGPYNTNGPGMEQQAVNGKMDQAWRFEKLETTPPTISDIRIKNLSKNGCTISCTVTDNVGVDRVEFPAWTAKGDKDEQDDLVWKSATSKSGDTYSFDLKFSDHNNEYEIYKFHIYAYDTVGNYTVRSDGVIDVRALGQNYKSDFPLEDGALYTIKNVYSGQAMAVTLNSNYVTQKKTAVNTYQQWKVIKKSDGYSFVNVETNKVLTVTAGRLLEGTKLSVQTDNDNAAQHIKLIYVGNGKYAMIAANSNMALQIMGNKEGDGLEQYLYKCIDSQLWIFEKVDISSSPLEDGKIYRIKNVYSNTYISTDNDTEYSDLVLKSKKADLSQQWKAIKNENGYYFVNMKTNNKISGLELSKDAGTPICQCGDSEIKAQLIKLIDAGNGKYAMIADYSNLAIQAMGNKEGDVLEQYAYKNMDSQLWTFEEVEESAVSIFPLIDGAIYRIKNSSSNKVLQVPKDDYNNDTQMTLAIAEASPFQQWKAIKLGDGYAFENVKTKKVLQIQNSSMDQGAKLVQYTEYYANTLSQHFKLVDASNGTYNVISSCSNQAIAPFNTNGPGIVQQSINGKPEQTWIFEKLETTAPIISNISVTNLSKNGCTISCTVTDNVGVDRVEFPAWTEKDGQDDLVWKGSTRKNGSTYSFDLKFSDHNNELGIYKYHIYAYDTVGNYSVQSSGVIDVRTLGQEYTSAFPLVDGGLYKIKSASSGMVLESVKDAKGEFILQQKNNEASIYQQWKAIKKNDGYSLVNITSNKELSVGTEAGSNVLLSDQNDLNQVIKLIDVGGGKYVMVFASSKMVVQGMGNQNGDRIQQQIYKNTIEQQWVFEQIETEIPNVTRIWYENVSVDGFTVCCTAVDNVAVDRAEFAVWTNKNGQDDLTLEKGTKVAENTFKYDVKRSKHNNEIEYYNIQIYTYDTVGNYSKNMTYCDLRSFVTSYDSVFPLEDGAIYKIINVNSGKALQPQNGSVNNDALLVQGSNYPIRYQQWKALKQSDGYILVNVESGKAMQVGESAITPGALVNQQSSDFENILQHVKIVDAGNGKYGIVSAYSNMALGIKDASLEDKAIIEQRNYGQNPYQQWEFIPLETEKPVLFNVRVENLTNDSFTVLCNVSDNSAVDRVGYSVWTGAEDLTTEFGYKLNANTYMYQVKSENHNGKRGVYYITVFAIDSAGNQDEFSLQVDTERLIVALQSFSLSETTITIEEFKDYVLSISSSVPYGATGNRVPSWYSENTDIATVDSSGKVHGSHAGTTNIVCQIDDIVVKCEVVVTGHQHTWDNGVITKNPTVQEEGTKTYTCIICKENRTEPMAKLTPPVENTNPPIEFGLSPAEDGTLLYYENGKVATEKFGFAEIDNVKFLIANGKYESGINGLFNDPEHPEDWYYCAEGRAQVQYTGLCTYDGAWFYVNSGKMDSTLVGFVAYDGGLFYVGSGRIMTEVNGLALDPASKTWYFLANGQVQNQYTGLAMYDNAWFYVVNGKLAEDYTGMVTYDGTPFFVVNGMLYNQ